MRLLLDTHIALWAVDGSSLLPAAARREIKSAEEVSVSTVSVWEIAIKHARRRGRADDIQLSGGEAHDLFTAAGFISLPITPAHAIALDTLPPLHGDPFDRMLVAQAKTEPMHLITCDARLKDYGALTIIV